MRFNSFILSPSGVITAQATGHPDEVILSFRNLCHILFRDEGAWRITDVEGSCPDDIVLESDMAWELRAKLKKVKEE